jgi:PAS domain S-box-containing protein
MSDATPSTPDELYRLLVEAVREYAIFMLDREGRIMSWNVGAERLKGYKADEIIGQHFSIFYEDHARRIGHPEEELRIAEAEGQYQEEGWRIRKDGTRFWANVLITAIHDQLGRHIGFAKVTRDMTDRRKGEDQLRESEERLRLLVESVKDYAIYMLDPEGNIVSWNAGAAAIKGYAAAEIMGRNFSIFYEPADVEAGRPARDLARARAIGRYEEEGWRVRKNGERFWASVVIHGVYDDKNELRGFAKVTRDLTERRRLEEEAREAENQRIQERMRLLEAQRAVKMRDEFISVAAHELRTPLTALQLKLQGTMKGLKKTGAGDVRPERFEDRLVGAARQVDRLSELVERLLDVSRITGDRLVMNVEEIDLVAVGRHVVDDLRDAAVSAGSEVRLVAPASLVGQWDKARIEQALTNLLSNAIKYGEGKPIDVSIHTVGGRARLVVADQGIGIPPADVERIFGRFERAVSMRHFGGLGLGLYVTRNIVEAHGGTIRVSSRAGHGSSFTIELPKRPPAKRADLAAGSSS